MTRDATKRASVSPKADFHVILITNKKQKSVQKAQVQGKYFYGIEVSCSSSESIACPGDKVCPHSSDERGPMQDKYKVHREPAAVSRKFSRVSLE